MKSNLLNLLGVLTLLLTTSGTPVTAQARLPQPNPKGTLDGYTAPELPSGTASSAPAAVTSSEATQVRVRQSFGQLPLYFVENQGQLDERVAYYIQGSDKTLYFTPDGVTFALTEQPQTADQRPPTADRHFPTSDFRPQTSETKRWAVKLDFVNANPNVRPIGQEKTEAVISYFKGTQDQWHAGLPTYASIIYPDLWPGIDLVYYGTANQLKYEFIVHPGADPNQIRLAYRGAVDVTLNAAGQLQVTTPLGGFTDDTPMAYQEMDGQRVPVPMAYQTSEVSETSDVSALHAARSTLYGFSVGPYDPARPLILDPAIIVYCGYIGGSDYDWGASIAVDGAGNAYVTGVTYSTEASFPVIGGPDLTFDGGYDAFVAKVNAAGTGLVYAGYIGGNDNDRGFGIAVDGAGNAYVTGYTCSTEASFPVTGGPDLTYNGGGCDAFVAKVNAAGTGLVYAGYIGGNGSDEGFGIAVDGAGNAYVTGDTYSTEATFPVAVGPDLTFNSVSGYRDAFVAKVNAVGTGLVYAGYIGGDGDDLGYGIAVDGAGNAYITGHTASTEAIFPVTVGPDLSYNGSWDAFVAKVNAAGTSLVYAGYIGGNDNDKGYGIAVDGAGNAYVTGLTLSTEASFPVTSGPDLTYNGGYDDAFVAKVNAAGTSLVYCGYIGRNGNDEGLGIAVDGAGNAYVTGGTGSTEASFPVIGGPDLTYNGDGDAFVAKVRADGAGLVYAGYIGGNDGDAGCGIAVDGAGNAYVTGLTSSTEASFPVTGGPDLTYNGGTYGDAFVAKVSAEEGPTTYTTSGRVTDSNSTPLAGVSVVAGAGGSLAATTNASGYYTITGLITGTYTLTPTKSGYTFSPPSRTVSVPPDATGQDFTATATVAWTLMYYLDGDNNLDNGYTLPVFNQLEAAASNPNVKVLALWDRLGAGGSSYYKLQYDTDLNRLATYTATVNYWPQGEVNMGVTETLVSFVNWARVNYPAQHYALILSNHGSGLGGGMQDDSTDSGPCRDSTTGTRSVDCLTVREIGTALASATLSGSNKIDVLYMDACLMGMLEDAYQVRDYVDYYIASENIKFGLPVPHFQTVVGITATTSPSQLATLFTTTYADGCNSASPSLPCTMSAADISKLNGVVTATNLLAQLLNSQMATSAVTLTAIHSVVQRFEMTGTIEIDTSDAYIDLYDFARLVKADFPESNMQAAAQAVMDTISAYTITERHRSGTTSGTTWNLDNSHGVAVFFPSTASSFYRASNYDFATGAAWPGSSYLSVNGSQATIEWGPMLVNYFQTTQPGGPDNPNPPLPLPLRQEYRVYLPVVVKQ